MKDLPGTLQAGGAAFPPTRWSMVADCAHGSEAAPGAAHSALVELCRDYWPPLYSFVRRRGHGPHDAQDLVQGFFVFLLESRGYERTDPEKGKFRSFLLASLKHYMADVRDHEHRLKRGGGQFVLCLDEELDAAEAHHARHHADTSHLQLDEERQFERRWAAELVARTLAQLAGEFPAGSPKARVFAALKPYLTGGAGLPGHDAVAAGLGVPVETLRSYLSRLRTRYRDLLRAEVARTVASEEDVDDELRHLCRVLTDAG